MPPSVHGDEMIVVKGEEDTHHHWSRPSSPASMSPQPGPAALAPAHRSPSRHLQSPGPLDERDNESHLSSISSAPIRHPVHTTESTPDTHHHPTHPTPSSNKRPRPNVMTTEERLMAMPEKRTMPWRPGVDPGADIETGGESRRKQIRFGCLLATRGDVVPTPCVSCANGRGKFSVCVADPSLFRGACAGCQLSGRPNRCSIKQGDDAAQSPGASTPGSGSRNVKKKLAKAHSPLMSKPDQRLPDEAPTWHNGSPQWPPELGIPQAHPQTNTAPDQPRWAAVNPPSTKSRPLPNSPLHSTPPIAHRPNGIAIPPSSTINQSPMGWATVNQQRPPPVAHPGYGMESNNGFPHRGTSQDRREDTVGNESSTGTLIDSLPKNKQRHLYGVLSGLQGGIETLQRELDSLKKALGVEDSE